jgi:DNA-binding SARP family transcriptional activator
MRTTTSGSQRRNRPDGGQKILAALLLGANRPVPTERLIDVVWGDRPSATARQQAQNAVGLLKSSLLTAVPAADMIADLTAWTRAHPYDEHLHCRLAEALHRASRTGEAVHVVRTLRRRLNDELGICPTAEIRAMEAGGAPAATPSCVRSGGSG